MKTILILLFFVSWIFLGCEKPDSILKIGPHTAKDNTDGLGVAVFNLNAFFDTQSSTSRDGYFDVSVTKESMTGVASQVRATMNTIQVQTIYIK